MKAIREASVKQLRDARWLENAIWELGASTARTGQAYKHKGLGVWQWPSEMAPYLVALSKLKIKSYAEIGLWYGGGFMLTVEYLRRFGLERALGIDNKLRGPVIEFAAANDDVELVESPSNQDRARYAIEEFKPDLVFIDGDHTYQMVTHDWELASSVAKYVGFHDTRWMGVKRLWKELADADKQEWWDAECNASGTGLVRV